jgi:hypothetical protein
MWNAIPNRSFRRFRSIARNSSFVAPCGTFAVMSKRSESIQLGPEI